jgi:hypothetical protein
MAQAKDQHVPKPHTQRASRRSLATTVLCEGRLNWLDHRVGRLLDLPSFPKPSPSSKDSSSSHVPSKQASKRRQFFWTACPKMLRKNSSGRAFTMPAKELTTASLLGKAFGKPFPLSRTRLYLLQNRKQRSQAIARKWLFRRSLKLPISEAN